ncbi:MAG: hypothetical protein CMH54_15085 [Myxococcales bacterium]|nr:hypothetical protein [Myxococcales bacterium]
MYLKHQTSKICIFRGWTRFALVAALIFQFTLLGCEYDGLDEEGEMASQESALSYESSDESESHDLIFTAATRFECYCDLSANTCEQDFGAEYKWAKVKKSTCRYIRDLGDCDPDGSCVGRCVNQNGKVKKGSEFDGECEKREIRPAGVTSLAPTLESSDSEDLEVEALGSDLEAAIGPDRVKYTCECDLSDNTCEDDYGAEWKFTVVKTDTCRYKKSKKKCRGECVGRCANQNGAILQGTEFDGECVKKEIQPAGALGEVDPDESDDGVYACGGGMAGGASGDAGSDDDTEPLEEDIASDLEPVLDDNPCTDVLNPQCKPKLCDDGLDQTGNDRCQWTVVDGDIMSCECRGEEPEPIQPCGDIFNPECKPNACDDGNPNTVGDRCVVVFAPTSDIPHCKCHGEEPEPETPCGELFNPECNPNECDDGDPSTVGDRCELVYGLDGDITDCECQGQDIEPFHPCGELFNPGCHPYNCDDGDPNTIGDRCELLFSDDGDLEACECRGKEPEPVDPCGDIFNPQCKPNECDDGLDYTQNDRCQWTIVDGDIVDCQCQGEEPEPVDPCGDIFNPECKPNACDDGNPNTVGDRCVLLFGPASDIPDCKCQGEEPEPVDPCGDIFNPQCKPYECDDGLDYTQNDRCQWTIVDGDIVDCQCQGEEPEPVEPCGDIFNPQCKPYDCDDGNPNTLGDRCVVIFTPGSDLHDCRCQGEEPEPVDPCGDIFNPQCKPVHCDDGNPNTVGDRCKLYLSPDGDTEDCRCVGAEVEPVDPCGDWLNPQCLPNKCDDGNPLTKKDRCKLVFTAVSDEPSCECVGKKPVIVDPVGHHPCGDWLNPQCKPNKCDDGNPLTIKDRCVLVITLDSDISDCRCSGKKILEPTDPVDPDIDIEPVGPDKPSDPVDPDTTPETDLDDTDEDADSDEAELDESKKDLEIQ